MTVTSWAENEVEIACNREKANSKGDDWVYGCNCYKSALKAYKSLINDDHSGMSYSITASILKRLLDELPLTPIEDTPDTWDERREFVISGKQGIHYQCKRRSALFKDIDELGNVTYTDIDRYVCYDINSPSISYHNGFISDIAAEVCPITFPYMPNGIIKVYCEDFIYDRSNGDFDTLGIFHLIDDKGEKMTIHRFFKWNKGHWQEINSNEYSERKANRAHLM